MISVYKSITIKQVEDLKMNQDIVKFGELLQTDPELRKKVVEAMAEHQGDLSVEDTFKLLAPLAQEYGFHATLEDFEEYAEAVKKNSSELSDDELDQVAGGGKHELCVCDEHGGGFAINDYVCVIWGMKV